MNGRLLQLSPVARRNMKMVHASDYDPETLLMSRQLFTSTISDYLTRRKTETLSDYCWYALSIKFKTDPVRMDTSIVLKNIRKILDKIRRIEEPVCHFDTSEVKIAVFEDLERLKVLFKLMQKAIRNASKVKNKCLQQVFGTLELNMQLARLSESGLLVFDKIQK